MPTANPFQANTIIRDSVIHQLEWDSEVDATDIGVTARGGVVTLTGFIDTYAGKLAAERAAKRVHGVRAVANDIQVRLRLERTDPEIAADIDRALRLRGLPDTVQAVVHAGHVSLTGSVEAYFVRAMAAETVRHVRGVRDVINHITVQPVSSIRDLRRRIVQTLHRCADVDARGVAILVEGSVVRLEGEVGSWAELEAIEAAVSHAPGITGVDNRLTVAPHVVPVPPIDAEVC